MTKHKKTQKDWIKIGNSFKNAYSILVDTAEVTGNLVGVTNKSYKKIDRALLLVDQAQYELENQMLREYPDLSKYWLRLFYGPEDFVFDPDSEEAKLFDPDGEDRKAMKGDDSNGD